jgi:DNA modification methylase
VTPNTYQIGEALAVLQELPPRAVHCCVTSPPYWGLRDYGHPGQLGLETTPEEYVERLVAIFREVRRVLRDDGTLWLNMGDSYALSGSAPPRRDHSGGQGLETYGKQAYSAASQKPARCVPHGLKPKDLVGIPWRVAFALQADGWYLRSDIVWSKPNPMPESVTDRPTKAHEYLFLLSKRDRYYYDAEAVRERGVLPAHTRDRRSNFKGESVAVEAAGMPPMARDGAIECDGHRNKRSVWTVATRPYPGAHFAVFPPALIKPCILAGCPAACCPECGAPWVDQSPSCDHKHQSVPVVVLDPFFGSGTTGMVAESLGRSWFGIELNPEYEPQIRERTAQRGLL